MNSRLAQLLRLIFSGIGILGCCWIIFRIFSPGELWLMIFIGLVLLCAYGIKLRTWPEKSTRIRWFGLLTETEVSVYQQLTIFGLIPISKIKRIEYYCESQCPLIQRAASQTMELALSTVTNALPFGGLFGNKVALNAIGFRKAIGSK